MYCSKICLFMQGFPVIATKKFCFILKNRKRFIFPFFLIFLSFSISPIFLSHSFLNYILFFLLEKERISTNFFCFFSQITVIFDLFYSCCVRPTHKSPSFFIMRIIACRDNCPSMHRMYRREAKVKNTGADECSKGSYNTSVESMDGCLPSRP